jgi:peroxiredoxin Q/BCP
MAQDALQMDGEPPEFELPNAGVGPDPLSFDDIVELADFAILLFLRDYHCPKCRAQVNRAAEHAERIKGRGAAVVAILPDSHERAQDWQEKYDLPFPLLADPARETGEAYDQERRFGVFGRLHDFVGLMPKAVVLDVRDRPEVIASHQGSSPGDRPEMADLLSAIDDLRDTFVFDCELVEC